MPDWQLAGDRDRIVMVDESGLVQATSDGTTWADIADVGALRRLEAVDVDDARIAIATQSSVIVTDGTTRRDVAIEWVDGVESTSRIDGVSLAGDTVLVASGTSLGVVDDGRFAAVEIPALDGCRDPRPRIARSHDTHLLDVRCADHVRWSAEGIDGRTWTVTPTLADPPLELELFQQDLDRPDLAGPVLVDGTTQLFGHPPGLGGDDIGPALPGPGGVPLLVVQEPLTGFYCC